MLDHFGVCITVLFNNLWACLLWFFFTTEAWKLTFQIQKHSCIIIMTSARLPNRSSHVLWFPWPGFDPVCEPFATQEGLRPIRMGSFTEDDTLRTVNWENMPQLPGGDDITGGQTLLILKWCDGCPERPSAYVSTSVATAQVRDGRGIRFVPERSLGGFP